MKDVQALAVVIDGHHFHVRPIAPRKHALGILCAAKDRGAEVRGAMHHDARALAVGKRDRDFQRERVAGDFAERLAVPVQQAIGERDAVVLPQRFHRSRTDEQAARKELWGDDAHARAAMRLANPPATGPRLGTT